MADQFTSSDKLHSAGGKPEPESESPTMNLQEALDWFERINAPLPADTKLHTVARAVRSIVEGTDIQWCEPHEAQVLDPPACLIALWRIAAGTPMDKIKKCRIVSRRLVE